MTEAPAEAAGRALNRGCQQRVDLARNRHISKQSHLTTSTVIWEPVRKGKAGMTHFPKQTTSIRVFTSRLLPAEIRLFEILCLHRRGAGENELKQLTGAALTACQPPFLRWPGVWGSPKRCLAFCSPCLSHLLPGACLPSSPWLCSTPVPWHAGGSCHAWLLRADTVKAFTQTLLIPSGSPTWERGWCSGRGRVCLGPWKLITPCASPAACGLWVPLSSPKFPPPARMVPAALGR